MIVGCEHHTGMGLCSACVEHEGRAVTVKSVTPSTAKIAELRAASMEREKRILEAARVCESEGLWVAAADLRARLNARPRY